jgi:hypothetical protein
MKSKKVLCLMSLSRLDFTETLNIIQYERTLNQNVCTVQHIFVLTNFHNQNDSYKITY